MEMSRRITHEPTKYMMTVEENPTSTRSLEKWHELLDRLRLPQPRGSAAPAANTPVLSREPCASR